LKLNAVRKSYLPYLGLLLISLSGSAMAIDPVYTGYFNDNAISGYDAVAYFAEGKPVIGSDDFTFDYMHATWKFSSQEHLDLFTADPIAYAPQYGGYCAYAIANGDTASAEPDLWTIHEGKLYLNYSRKINARWREDIPGYIEKANNEWTLFMTE
jgi:YHS domain-containing protein